MRPVETVHAHAKVNLVLEVLARRETHHDIVSIVQTISLHDTLTFEHSDDVALTCSEPSLVEDNLVTRAALLLRQTAGVNCGIRIHLEKHIPWGAGLGGGSSDAASTLLTLNRIWGCGLDAAEIARLATQLGADVPLFLTGGTVLIEGRGDKTRVLPQMKQMYVVLLVPESSGQPLKTATLYGALRPEAFTKGQFARAAEYALEKSGSVPHKLMFNSFEPAALEYFDGLRAAHDAFSRVAARPIHVSGSGPCLYTLCHTAGEAQDIANRLRDEHYDARIALTTGQVVDR